MVVFEDGEKAVDGVNDNGGVGLGTGARST